MKVLAIVADISPEDLGGGERHFVEVLKVLAPKLSRSTVLVGPSDILKETYSKFPSIHFETVAYPHVPNLFGFFYILFATPKAIWLTWKNNYDLIWAKQEYPQAQVGALTKIFSGKPLYITTQNPILHKEEFVFKGEAQQQVKDFLTSLIGPFISFAFRRADVVAAVSQYSAALAKKIGAKNVTIIPNGVDKEKLRTTSRADAGSELSIVTTSTLIPRNGIDTLIKACALLPKNLKWKLTIAGDGSLRTELEQLVKKERIGPRIDFLGMVDSRKVMDLLDKNYVFVRPSRAEGFGVSFVEAMARGLPVIGTAVGGLVDFLKDKETGLVVPVDDPQALSEALVLIWKDRRLYQHIQQNAYTMIRDKYNWSKIGDDVYRVFNSIV